MEPGGSIIVIATRWHEDDLIGRLLSNEYRDEQFHGDQWEHIKLPALAEEEDPLDRPLDTPLWPERYDSAGFGGDPAGHRAPGVGRSVPATPGADGRVGVLEQGLPVFQSGP